MERLRKLCKIREAQLFSPDIRRKTAALEQAGDFRFGQLSVKAAGKAVGQGLAPHGKGGLDNAEE